MAIAAPKWFKSWASAILSADAEAEIDLNAFRGGRRPLPAPGASSTILEEAKRPRPRLVARVQERVSGPELESAVRLDLWRRVEGADDEPVRSYAVGWRGFSGTLIATKCAKNSDTARDDQGWTVEVGLNDSQREGRSDVAYEALYHHLLPGGRALPREQLARVRSVNRTLATLGLELRTNGDDPRCHPILFRPGLAPAEVLHRIAATVVARQVLAGLFGSPTWRPHATRLMSFAHREELTLFAQLFAWDDGSEAAAHVLEADLCRRFTRWAEGRGAPARMSELSSDLLAALDGQRPDIELGDETERVMVEAKLGLTRDSVRTGLAQAAEYAFHARRAESRIPAVLLLGEPPDAHGRQFANFVEEVASSLHIPVFVETPDGVAFRPWPNRGAFLAWTPERPSLLLGLVS